MSEKLPSLRIGQIESELPIIQGGMSVGISTVELPVEVAKEGGIGTIGAVGLGYSPEIKNHGEYIPVNRLALKNVVDDALEKSENGNIAVNLMVAVTDYEGSVETVVKSGIKAIVSGAGLPLDLPELVGRYLPNGQVMPELIPIVSSVKAAKLIIKYWVQKYGILPSAIVVETPNTAGGHLGERDKDNIGNEELSLEHVIPELVRHLKSDEYIELLKKYQIEIHDIPVIGAGGIWDRADIDKMLKLGASGVQMATRFLTTNESAGSQGFKDIHLNNTAPIVLVDSPVGMPGRAIENDFVKRVKSREIIESKYCVECLRSCKHRTNRKSSFCIGKALYDAKHGDKDNGLFFSGFYGYLLKKDEENGITNVKQVIDTLK